MPIEAIGPMTEDHSLPISKIPKTALQAIYHAITGKTESMKKTLNKNVVIRSRDIDRLHGMLIDQVQIHKVEFQPTVTVSVKLANDRAHTYSSWERFKALGIASHEITSDITLKYEFVIQLPDTPQPQRCVVSINLDSALPMISAQDKAEDHSDPFSILFFPRNNWRTAIITIDFVDFLVGKSFLVAIEEWFSSLDEAPRSVVGTYLYKRLDTIRATIGQFGNIGFASCLSSYALFRHTHFIRPLQLLSIISIGLFIRVVFTIWQSSLLETAFKRISQSLVPSVILLTESDEVAFNRCCAASKSPLGTAAKALLTGALAVGINVGSSYLYTYLTGR